MVKLEKNIRREIDIAGKPHVVTIDPSGVKIVPKGCRRGVARTWEHFGAAEPAKPV